MVEYNPKNNYKRSVYLSDIQDINSRKKITKLQLDCSKLKTHLYLKPGTDNNCPYCPKSLDSTQHLLLECPEFVYTRSKFKTEVNKL